MFIPIISGVIKEQIQIRAWEKLDWTASQVKLWDDTINPLQITLIGIKK